MNLKDRHFITVHLIISIRNNEFPLFTDAVNELFLP